MGLKARLKMLRRRLVQAVTLLYNRSRRGGMRMIALRVVCLLLVCPLASQAQVASTICEVQEYDINGLSPLVGEMVTVGGAVTFPPGYLVPLYTAFYIGADACGVHVFSFDQFPDGLELGDSVEVTGTVEEYITPTRGATTEIAVVRFADVEIVSTGNPEPVPSDMGIAEMQVEDNEGRLLRTAGVVARMDYDRDTFMDLTDGIDTVRVYRRLNESVSFVDYFPGDTLRVTGILYQSDPTSPWLEGYWLIPRFQEDIEQLHSTAVRPTSWGRVKVRHR
jgi:hypothetical protein